MLHACAWIVDTISNNLVVTLISKAKLTTHGNELDLKSTSDETGKYI